MALSSTTSRISTLLATVAVAIAVGALACPGHRGSSPTQPRTLVSVSVTPANPTIAAGTAGQLRASGRWSDGKSTDVTGLAEWSSADPAVATVSTTHGSSGLVSGLTLGTTLISATYMGISGSVTLTISAAGLVAIEVTPTNPQIALGTNAQLAATGRFTDGTTQDLTAQVTWESSTAAAATISNESGSQGLAHSTGLGDTTIRATLSGRSGSTTLTVSPAVLVSVEVTPTDPSIALGTQQPFAATGTFSDGTIQDLTAEVVWASSAGTAEVSNSAGSQGLAQSIAVGSASISATHSGISGSTTLSITSATLVSIEVTPVLPVIALGTAQAFQATGRYTDGTRQDLTADVAWASSEAAVASISNNPGTKGVASSIAVGSATISAALGGISGSTTLGVTSATLVAIDVTPSHPSAALGTTLSFTATGTYTDSSTQDLTNAVTWTTSDASVASVSNAAGSRGLATTVSVGSTEITATFGGTSASTTLGVSAATLVAIGVSPDTAALSLGTLQPFAAFGVLTDGTKQDLTDQVTWSSSNASIATVSNAAGSHGIATAVGVGSITLTAGFAGISGSATVDVSAATLDSIDVAPFVLSIAKGTQVSFSAFGNYSDGSTQDLTTQVTWSSSAPVIAAISNADGSQGLATGVDIGSATITAGLAGIEGSLDLGVTNALLESIQVTPANPKLHLGASCALQATGLFSGGSTQDLTRLVTWSSYDGAVATVSNASGSEGLVQSVGAGSATLSANFSGKTSATTVTVSAATLVSIAVSPVDAFVPTGYSLGLQALGTYSDNSTENLNAKVLWTSSNPAIAKVSNSSGTEGRATGVAVGSATLTATAPGGNGTTTLTVSNEVLNSIVVEPPSLVLAVGGKQQMTATGYFSGGSVLDLTSQVKWLVTPRNVATVNNTTSKGRVTARKVGHTTIRAGKGSSTGTASLSVSP